MASRNRYAVLLTAAERVTDLPGVADLNGTHYAGNLSVAFAYENATHLQGHGSSREHFHTVVTGTRQH